MRRFFYRPRRRQGPLCEPRPLTAIRRQKGLSAVPGGGPGGPPPPWPQACDRHAGSAGCTEGARPALVARLRLGLPGRPTLPDPGHRRRLHPRVPGGGRRHLDLRRAARAQSRRAGCPSRRAGDDRQRQWSGAHLTRDPGVDQPGWPGLALHSPWQANPERLRRELHRPAARRTAQRGDLRKPRSRPSPARAMAGSTTTKSGPHSAHAGMPPVHARLLAAGARLGLVDGPAPSPAINPKDSPHERGTSRVQVTTSTISPSVRVVGGSQRTEVVSIQPISCL
jgi:hypothetical protein